MKVLRVRTTQVVHNPDHAREGIDSLNDVFTLGEHDLADTGNGVLITGEHGQTWVPYSMVRYVLTEAEGVKAPKKGRSA